MVSEIINYRFLIGTVKTFVFGNVMVTAWADFLSGKPFEFTTTVV